MCWAGSSLNWGGAATQTCTVSQGSLRFSRNADVCRGSGGISFQAFLLWQIAMGGGSSGDGHCRWWHFPDSTRGTSAGWPGGEASVAGSAPQQQCWRCSGGQIAASSRVPTRTDAPLHVLGLVPCWRCPAPASQLKEQALGSLVLPVLCA